MSKSNNKTELVYLPNNDFNHVSTKCNSNFKNYHRCISDIIAFNVNTQHYDVAYSNIRQIR